MTVSWEYVFSQLSSTRTVKCRNSWLQLAFEATSRTSAPQASAADLVSADVRTGGLVGDAFYGGFGQELT